MFTLFAQAATNFFLDSPPRRCFHRRRFRAGQWGNVCANPAYLVNFREESRANFLANKVIDRVERRHGGLECFARRAGDEAVGTAAAAAAVD